MKTAVLLLAWHAGGSATSGARMLAECKRLGFGDVNVGEVVVGLRKKGWILDLTARGETVRREKLIRLRGGGQAEARACKRGMARLVGVESRKTLGGRESELPVQLGAEVWFACLHAMIYGERDTAPGIVQYVKIQVGVKIDHMTVRMCLYRLRDLGYVFYLGERSLRRSEEGEEEDGVADAAVVLAREHLGSGATPEKIAAYVDLYRKAKKEEPDRKERRAVMGPGQRRQVLEEEEATLEEGRARALFGATREGAEAYKRAQKVIFSLLRERGGPPALPKEWKRRPSLEMEAAREKVRIRLRRFRAKQAEARVEHARAIQEKEILAERERGRTTKKQRTKAAHQGKLASPEVFMASKGWTPEERRELRRLQEVEKLYLAEMAAQDRDRDARRKGKDQEEGVQVLPPGTERRRAIDRQVKVAKQRDVAADGWLEEVVEDVVAPAVASPAKAAKKGKRLAAGGWFDEIVVED